MAAELQIFFPLVYLLKSLEVMTHANVEEILPQTTERLCCLPLRLWTSLAVLLLHF